MSTKKNKEIKSALEKAKKLKKKEASAASFNAQGGTVNIHGPVNIQTSEHMVNNSNDDSQHGYGDHGQITVDIHGREHVDISALKQGRQVVSDRKVGDLVNVKNMTPKEYRNYKISFWDGVETREGAKNWEEFEWPQSSGEKNSDDRRSSHRRLNKSPYNGKSRRSKSRRQEDFYNVFIYYMMMFVTVCIILAWVAAIAMHGESR